MQPPDAAKLSMRVARLLEHLHRLLKRRSQQLLSRLNMRNLLRAQRIHARAVALYC